MDRQRGTNRRFPEVIVKRLVSATLAAGAKSALALAAVTLLATVGYTAAYLLRFEGALPASEWAMFESTLGVAVLAKFAACWRFGVHRAWGRLVAFEDMVRLVKAVTAATIALTVLDSLALTAARVPRSVTLLDWGATLMLLAAARCAPRLVDDWRQRTANQHNSIGKQPRPVAAADLLARPPIELNDPAVREWIAGRRVLVTGAAGSIGSELCRQLLRLAPAKLVLVDRSETGQFFLERELRELCPDADVEVAMADVTDGDRLWHLFDEHRPQIVVHAAAYKHVPMMESHAGEAVKNIVLATRMLADLADEFDCEAFVLISTDKAVNPASVMGSCKRLAEQYVEARAESSACRFVTVRFGNVLDSAGSVMPIFREQIARGGPVTVTHPDMVRYFMTIPEAAQLVLQAGAMGRGGEVFVLDMGEPVRIVDLARNMIRLSGLRVGEDVEIHFTGLRPGEKLFEELYGEGEKRRPTLHPKIMAAAGAPRRLVEVIAEVRRLEAKVNAPPEVLRELLAAAVVRSDEDGAVTLARQAA
jgi:FlaA1/EpsC-like NDP-sugar epimerase